ncbi:hypothetical protein D3C86_1836510 [compost metagenome]
MRGLAGSLFYDGDAVAVLQYVDHGLKELGLLVHKHQLLLEFLDTLFGSLVAGVRHGDAPLPARTEALWLQSYSPSVRTVELP